MSEKTDKPVELEPRFCIYSGTPFIPRREDQVYCSKECALAHARQLADERTA